MKIKNAYLYVFDTMSDWEYGHLIAELHSGRYFKKNFSPINVVTVGASKDMVLTKGGLNVKPDLSIDECTLDDSSLLILPGGDTWEDDLHKPLLNKVGQALSSGSVVAAICGATIALADMGYLDTRVHTSNNLEYMKMICSNYQGEERYEMVPAITDQNMITASGTAPLEFAYEVLKAIDVCDPDPLYYWYKLNQTHEGDYFFQLMNSLEK